MIRTTAMIPTSSQQQHSPPWTFRLLICFRNIQNKSEKTDVLLFFREYCTDVKKSENNTEFLLNFNEFIDRNTPSSPSCKYSFQFIDFLINNTYSQVRISQSEGLYAQITHCCFFLISDFLKNRNTSGVGLFLSKIDCKISLEFYRFI